MFYKNSSFKLLTRLCETLNFALSYKRRLNFYFSTFELQTQIRQKIDIKLLTRQLISTRSWLISLLVTTTIFIIFWDFLMFYQMIFSPQVKQYTIITYKHGIYKLPYELPNEIRKLGNIRKVLKLHRIIVHCSVFQPKWKFC